MRFKFIVVSVVIMTAFAGAADAAWDGLSDRFYGSISKEMRNALKLYDAGMFSHANRLMETLSDDTFRTDPEGYAMLCDVLNGVTGYENRMEAFFVNNPHSFLIPRIRYAHAMNLFDAMKYKAASEELGMLSVKMVPAEVRVEYLFKKAYCHLENRELQKALEDFAQVEKMPFSDYTAPSRYAMGYAQYQLKNFDKAAPWFEKAMTDGRFRDISSYYLMECRFMMKDYKYVTENGQAMYDTVPVDRKPHLARIISECYLVLGDADMARKYYELLQKSESQKKSRADWFYSGSVLYAVDDYKGAVENFTKMTERTDSIGQIANYNLGYSYIQTRDMVSAMGAFKDASLVEFDPAIAEDAFFNYAKLAFDLNDDTSVFHEYLKKYPHLKKGDRIYSYIAVAALQDRDYAAAVEAFDQIDELDDDMTLNYMKANYLRANQLIRNGSYRKAVPCLKAAAYYSERNSRFNQLARFWLAESYYRNDQYADAREGFMELYNASALDGQAEAYLIPFNIAYCFFKEGNYPQAKKWFGEYLGEKSVRFRKEALIRKADCDFIAKEYGAAASSYDIVLKDYYHVDDIYPYYQAALAYGLNGNMSRKIELLGNVMTSSPEAEFYPEALFELGRSYVVKEDDDKAMECFRKITSEVKDSTFVARAFIEMGSLSRNQSQFNDALEYYKTVVEKMPLSGYAEDALLAIESIYQTRNEPDDYLAYIERIGKGGMKTDDEKEDMIFNSAEQIFLSENYQKALVALQSYVERYPQGKSLYKADFYMAESYKNLGKSEQACDSYRKVIEGGEGSFVELSMLNFANLSYKLERWDEAFGGYSSLLSSARLENNAYTALLGMMRSAYRGHMWSEAEKNAAIVAADPRSGLDVVTEAEYIVAKSCLATSRRSDAILMLERLAQDVGNKYGAEAAYMIIQDCYDRGDFEAVEAKVYAFADAGSEQLYWMARSFIVLGDSFVERDDIHQAKATFESIRDGYTPASDEDDVLDNVMMRLRKLEEMSQEEVQENEN